MTGRWDDDPDWDAGVAEDSRQPLSDRLYAELDDAQRQALGRGGPVEPTEEETANGWTSETLTSYLAERQAASNLAADPHSLHRRLARRPNRQNHKYRVLRWRAR